MQYYTFELDETSKELCVICTPFGNYRYNRLPMGVSQSPDIAQEIMESLLRHLEEIDVYIDDIGVFTDSWQHHLVVIDKVLTILQDSNFTVNPFKCEWGVKETDWLGFWLTPTGLKPWKKKIDAILALDRPKTVSELRSFIGGVTFYRDMFRKRSHLLSPLTAQVGKKKLDWTPECEQAFQAIKALLAKDAFIHYPDHNQPFHIYCDASDLQLGSVIMQNGKPVAYYSRKLNSAQKNYTVGEKELLSIVETLKEYRNMLLGCTELHVYTDHRNLTYNKLTSQRVLRWRLFLEDFAPQFHYIKGEDNKLADALSRLPFSERQKTPEIHKNPVDSHRKASPTGEINDDFLENYYSMAIDDPQLLECFVHLPHDAGIPFVLGYDTIAAAQERDAELLEFAQTNPTTYVRQLLAPNTQVYCYIPAENAPWKIYLPDELLNAAVRWYHLSLGHSGMSRLHDTMKMHFFHKNLRQTVENVVSTCDSCQKNKNNVRGFGLVAPREAQLLPWRQVAVDSIGPWTLQIGPNKISFHALTIIDQVTNLVEAVRLENMTAAHVALQFENTWLSRYPRPVSCIFDQGTEFTGHKFQEMLYEHGIHAAPIGAKNPQANSICERMHQSVGNTLRVLRTLHPPEGVQTANQLVDTALANAVYATRATFHSGLQTTPGALVFHRDMVLDIPVIADLETIRNNRQQLIDNRLILANRKRFSYDYVIGDEVLKISYKPNKLEPRNEGPYTITQVHTNGTVTIRLAPHVTERISLRRIKPYRR